MVLKTFLSIVNIYVNWLSLASFHWIYGIIFKREFSLNEATSANCVVPENIQTPTTEGIGNSRGVGGSEAQEIPEGTGVGP